MKALKKYYTINLISLTTIYLISVFIKWSFYLPLKWILDIPSWTQGWRLLFAFMFILYVFMQYKFYKSIDSNFNYENHYIPFIGSLITFVLILIAINS